MKYSVEKPGSPSELVHHGVKGQKWGVRKEEDTGGGQRVRKAYNERLRKGAERDRLVSKGQGTLGNKVSVVSRANALDLAVLGTKGSAKVLAKNREDRLAKSEAKIAKNEANKKWMKALQELQDKEHLSPAEAAKKLKENQDKFGDKFGPSDDKGNHGLTDTQKKLLIGAGVGAVVIGGAYLYKKGGTPNLSPLGSDENFRAFQLKEKQQYLKDVDAARLLSGKHVTPDKFNELQAMSLKETWGFSSTGFLQPESFSRPEFELPIGHTFHRISTTVEDKFGHATYSTHSIEDFNRYMVGFTGELMGAPLHHVTWQATKPIKVPNTATVLDTLHEVLSETHSGVPHAEVLRQYQSMSGGSWGGETPKKLIKALQEKGYHALVDEMDAGVIGETPLVFFGTDAVGPKSSTPITQATFKAAHDNLLELENRKFGDTSPYYSVAKVAKPSLEQLAELAA